MVDPRKGAPKKPTPVTAHPGMHHRANGKLTAGISKTQAAHPLDDAPIHQPTVGKRLLKPVAPHDSMDPLRHDRGNHCDLGQAILDEAVTTGGAHPLK